MTTPTLLIAGHAAAPDGGQLAAGVIAAAFVALAVIAMIWGAAHVVVGVPLRRHQPPARLLALMLGSHALRRETPAKLGFALRNLEGSLVRFTPVVLLLALILLALGSVARTIRHITPQSGFSSLVLYWGWGLFQQYALNGYFVNRPEFRRQLYPYNNICYYTK
jgi:hypothetical protein